jgi:hypothetical protein
MTRALGLVIAAMLAASPVGASPVTRTCAYKGRLQIGALTVTLDESARTVKTEYGGGRVYVYRDGARALNCAPRAAFQNPRAPCVWRALWDFGTV